MRASGPTAAVAVALLGGAAAALGSVLPVVSGGARGFDSAALLVVLAVAPAAVAGLLLLRRPGRPGPRGSAAAGVVTGLAALAPGRFVLNLQLATDASVTNRPALYMPETLAAAEPASGLWFLLGGQLVMLLAGFPAVRTISTTDRSAGASPDRSVAGVPARGVVLTAGGVGALTAVGSLLPPFASSDAYLLAGGAMERGALGLTGSLLFAAALPLAGVSAAGTGRPLFARGCFLGLALGALTTILPDLVAIVIMSELSLRPGAIVVALGALGLLALATVRGDRSVSPAGGALGDAESRSSLAGSVGAGAAAAAGDAVGESVARAGDARLPSLRWFEVAVAMAALVTCAAALTGSLTARVTSALGGSAGTAPRWSLVAAGVLIGLLGVGLLLPRVAGSLRPVMSVAWVSVPLAGMPVLGTGVAAGETGGVLTPGPGSLWSGLAIALAAVTACLSTVAGVVEREGVPRGVPGRRSRTVVLVGSLLGAVAFLLPVATSAEAVVPGLVTNLGIGSWGLLVGLLVVSGAGWVACYSRPTRAAALLVGSTLVLALRTADWPLTTLRASDAAPTVGWWLALLGTLVLAVAAGTVVTGRLPSRNTARTG